MNEQKAVRFEAILWQKVIDMPATEHERKSYYITLYDGEKEIPFILRLSADGTMVAEPYVNHEYDYDAHHYDDDEYDDDEYDDEDDDSYYEED